MLLQPRLCVRAAPMKGAMTGPSICAANHPDNHQAQVLQDANDHPKRLWRPCLYMAGHHHLTTPVAMMGIVCWAHPLRKCRGSQWPPFNGSKAS